MPFPLDPKFVDALEAELGARLPGSYRSAMVRENGGERRFRGTVWFLHPIKDTSDRKRLSRTCNHVVHETKSRAGYGDWPDGAIEIAHDQSGDCLMFLKSGSALENLDDR